MSEPGVIVDVHLYPGNPVSWRCEEQYTSAPFLAIHLGERATVYADDIAVVERLHEAVGDALAELRRAQPKAREAKQQQAAKVA